MPTVAAPIVVPDWHDTSTGVAEVADELARRWNAATDSPDGTVGEKGMAAARASVLNLIVFVATPEAAEDAIATLQALGTHHPSRAIILVAEADDRESTLSAEIRTHCLIGAANLPTCYDEVILTVAGEAAHHLDGVVAPLVIHDLPTHVWWPGDPPLADPIFDQLIEIGDRVIINTADFTDLLTGLRRVGGLRRRSGIGDLTWERLAPWLELTAEFFDAARFRRYLPNLNRLTLTYATDGDAVASPEAGPLLFAGWLATRLGWRRASRMPEGGGLHLRLEGAYQMVEMLLQPQPSPDHRPGEITGLHLRAHGETGSAEFVVERRGGVATLASNADGMTARLRHAVLADEADPALLRRQLGAGRRDHVYEDAVRAAAILLAEARGAS
jgi:glucose-6-phosphate dehydrogenase assembly protein OpcA